MMRIKPNEKTSAVGTFGSMAKLNSKSVLRLEIRMPKPHKQMQILRIIEAQYGHLESLEAGLSKLRQQNTASCTIPWPITCASRRNPRGKAPMMLDLQKELDDLLTLPSETEWVEFKEAKTSFEPEKLGKYFSALSNEANLKRQICGWLVFGVTDKLPRRIVGTRYKSDREVVPKICTSR